MPEGVQRMVDSFTFLDYPLFCQRHTEVDFMSSDDFLTVLIIRT